MSSEIAKVYDLLCRHQLTVSDVERIGGFGLGYIGRIKDGKKPCTPGTLSRIRFAIARLKLGDREPSDRHAAGAYRLALAFVADKHKVSAADILASDPAKRATADASWMQAAKIRRLAIYIANQYLGVPQAELARASGLSKAAVSIAMNDVEDMRGEPETEVLLKAIEEAFW